MKSADDTATRAATAARVAEFYNNHPYPPPADDIDAYRRAWTDERRRADAYLFWPDEPYRDDRSILVAGCGTNQAAHYAVRWPHARVVGIDVSEASIAHTLDLKRTYTLENLEVRHLAVERAGDLKGTFEQVVCTGVLHHLASPSDGLRALRQVLAPRGALHLMLYAPHGRAGIYMMQEYCRRLSVSATASEIQDLVAALHALPPGHPLEPLLKNSPDFASPSGIADALLNPNDRAYSVPQLFGLLDAADLTFGRWLRQAPYVPACGAPATTPHAGRLARLPRNEQFAAMELFRGTMARHSAIAYRNEDPPRMPDFDAGAWPRYVPVRLPDTIVVRERLPAGAAAVLINRAHSFTDLYFPIDESQLALFNGVNGIRTIEEITAPADNRERARTFFQQLWLWDQVVFDVSKASSDSKTGT
ncbi:MAG: class I SAM-dependent methyltransferase [Candidatus Eremiobacteraeota bacterium]|nr:class I SAM-dependent methyltransferase [Candidatus Eremiobacteraeota bacterium]